MSDPLVHTGHRRVLFVRRQPVNGEMPTGIVIPVENLAQVPTGWTKIGVPSDRFPPAEERPSFGRMSEDDALAAVVRFMDGESVIDLAQAYGEPTDVIERAIRWFVTLED